MTDKNISGDWYINNQLDFDKKLIHYRYRTIRKYFQKGNALELGSADGQMTKYLVNDFDHLTSVDGSRELLDRIPNRDNHEKVHSFFEEYEPEKKFNTIIMEHILEHVDDPVALMQRASNWLADDGVMILGVPNALSIHRLVAVKMGLLESPYQLNARDHALGHQRVYDIKKFKEDIESANLAINKVGGVFFKPLSNGQIEEHWTEEMQEGFYKLGEDFPDNAAEIYAVCKKKEV